MAEKKPTLANTLADLRKKGEYRVGSLSDFDMTTQSLTTGNLTIDALTGCGGLPLGRVCELYGQESSGKTTTALQAAARLQEEPGCHHTGFWDHEASLDERYVRALGIDPDAKCEECGELLFLYEQPRSFEHGANLFRPLMPWITLLITDSVAAMVSEIELHADTGKVDVGTRGRLMYQYMRQVINPISRTGTCMVFLNHIQDVIDTSPMGRRMMAQGIRRQTTPGGRGLKFYASLRMEFKQIGQVKDEVYDKILNERAAVARQTRTNVTVTKNKVGDPFGKAEVRVRFGKGFSNEWSALDVLTRHGLIKKDTGGIFRVVTEDLRPTPSDVWGVKNGVPWVKGENSIISEMEENPEWRGRLISRARELVSGGWDVKLAEDEQKAVLAEDEDDPAMVEEMLNADLEQVPTADLDSVLGAGDAS